MPAEWRRVLLLNVGPVCAALSIAACAGCDRDDDPCASVPVGEPSLEILGSPEESGTTVEPFIEGSMRPLIHGMQAGFHVWTNLRVQGLCFRNVTIRRSIRRVADGALIIEQGERLTFHALPDDPTTGQLEQAFAFFLCPDPLSRQIEGERLRMQIQLTDPNGRTVSGRADFVPECNPETQGGDFFGACRDACAGSGASESDAGVGARDAGIAMYDASAGS